MRSVQDEIWWFRGAVCECFYGEVPEEKLRQLEKEMEGRHLTPEFVVRHVDFVREKSMRLPEQTAEQFFVVAENIKRRLLRHAVLAPEFA